MSMRRGRATGRPGAGLKPRNPIKTLSRLFAYFKYNKFLFIGGITSIIFGSLATVATNGMLSPIIDSLVTDYDFVRFTNLIIQMVALVFVVAFGSYYGNLLMAKLAQQTIHKIREEMFEHMQKLPLKYFDTHSHGELMSTFTNDVDMLNQSLEQSVSQIIVSVIQSLGHL